MVFLKITKNLYVSAAIKRFSEVYSATFTTRHARACSIIWRIIQEPSFDPLWFSKDLSFSDRNYPFFVKEMLWSAGHSSLCVIKRLGFRTAVKAGWNACVLLTSLFIRVRCSPVIYREVILRFEVFLRNGFNIFVLDQYKILMMAC